MPAPTDPETIALLRLVRRELRAAGDATRARQMAAYMKTDMPFYGVQKPARVRIERAVLDRFPLETRAAYRHAVTTLWAEPQREAKYLAIQLARRRDQFITLASVPMYERMIRQGAWWDFVDDLAIRLVGRVQAKSRAAMRKRLDRWIEDRDMWIRRAAIISQIVQKENTDAAQLFDYCRRCMHEKPFFIRKAIGWALRSFAATDPAAITEFLRVHRDELSPLSFREAAKWLAIHRA